MEKLSFPEFADVARHFTLRISPAYIFIASFVTALSSLLAAEPPLPSITGTAAIVIDRNSGQVNGVKNPDAQRAMASTTKIMTALLAIEQSGSNIDAIVGPIGSAAANKQGSTMNLDQGDKISLRELLYGLMLPSGNDAAVAIAEWVSGSEAAFVTLMNQRAQALGLTNTAYRNPYGLDPAEYGAPCGFPFNTQTNCGHYSTARNMVTLARFAMSQPLFAQLVQTVNYTPSTWRNAANQPRTVLLHNDNLLLSGQSMAYPGANGVKTGATPNAGHCLVAGATRFGRSMLTVVLGSANDTTRHNESKKLLDFGFSFPKITSVSRPTSDPSSGHLIITGQSLPNASITIREAPSFPGPFSVLGATTANSSTGVFQFFDAGATTLTQRFYQASTP